LRTNGYTCFNQNRTTLLKLILTASFLLLTTLGLTQDPAYHHYTTSNGLSSSEVYDIIQDDWGYIWFSTDNGLTRYDGYTFKHYSTNDGLTNNTIFKFFKDDKGRIWCTTFEPSVFLIVGEEPQFIPYQRNDIFETLGTINVLDQIYFDSLNIPVFTFLNALGYLSINAQGDLENNLITSKQDGILQYHVDSKQNTFTYVTLDSEEIRTQKILGKTLGGLHKINGRRFGTVSFGGLNTFILANDSVFRNENGRESILFIGSELLGIDKLDSTHFAVLTRSDGAFVYNKHGVITQRLLQGKAVSSMYIDHENGTWISTLNDGVFYFKNAEVKTEHIKVENEDIIDLAFDNEKRLWIATQNGDVWVKSNNGLKWVSSSQLKRPALLSFNKSDGVMYYLSNGKVWNSQNSMSVVVGSTSNIEAQKNGSVLIFGIHSAEKGSLKNGEHESLHSGYRFYDGVNFKNKWYFATEKGLFREEKKNLFQVGNSLKSNPTFGVRIEDLCLFQNNLLIASRGNGIVIYNGNKIIGHITTKDGLTSNFVSKMYPEDEHTLWVCTNVGLNRIRINDNGTYSISSVTYKDGLSSNEVSSLAIDDDKIWVGTKEGLNYFPRSYFDRSIPTIDYRLKLRKVFVNDKKWNGMDNVSLSYDQNRLEFHFAGISFNQSEELTYRYKLEGVDESWTYTKNRSVTYPKLAPGSYAFIVQLKGENREWKMQRASMNLTISPPFWKRWWFKLSVILSVTLLIYGFFRFRVLIYNKHLVRELLRQVLKRLSKSNTPHIIVREGNNDVKIETGTILFVKSDRNYLEIHTETGRHVIREKLGDFLEMVPDPLEFLRVRRSYIIRIDKVTRKGKKHIYINEYKIDVGETYLSELKKISL